MVNSYLHEKYAIVTGLAPIAPSTSAPDYVSLKGALKFTAIILCDNATTVTGSAILVKEATTVAGGSAATLTLTKMWANVDTAAGDTLTETAVTLNTFTTAAVDNKNMIYIIEVDPDELSAGFDCIALTTGDTTAQILSVTYIIELKHARALPLTQITD